MKYFALTLFTLVAILHPRLSLAESSDQSLPAPELMSASNPAAIPEDHKAIIESEKVVSRVSADSLFAAQRQLKQMEILSGIAAERQKIALANAESCKLNRNLCKDLGVTNFEESIKTPEQNTVELKAREEQEKKAIAIAHQKQLIANDSSILIQAQLLAISGNEAVLRINGNQASLSVGQIHSNIRLARISDGSVDLVAIRTGKKRTVSIADMYTRPINVIDRFPKEESEASPEVK